MSVDMSKHFGWGALLKFTAPSIAMMIFASVYGIVDGLFVSNFAGKTAFSAVNLVMPFIMILSSVGFMMGTGGSAIVAKTRGEGDEARANRYFSLIVYAAFVMGLVIAVLGIVFTPQVCVLLGASPEGELFDYCVLYGRMIFVSLPFFVLQYVFQSFFVTAGKPQLGFYVILAAGLTNIVLDALFVGVFGWGIVGAALATNVSELMGGLIPLVYFFRKNGSLLRLGKTRVEMRIVGKACANGSSELMSNIAMSLVSVLYNWQLLTTVGPDGVAAYGVIMYIALIFSAVFMGYSMGSAPLMSYQYGARNHGEMRSLLKKSLIFVGVFGVVMCVTAQLCAGHIARIFVGYDENLCAFTENASRIYALAFVVMGFSTYGSAFFTSLNNGVVSALISFLRLLVFETSSVIVLPMIFGIGAIWYSACVADVLSLIVTIGFIVGLGGHYGYLGAREQVRPSDAE